MIFPATPGRSTDFELMPQKHVRRAPSIEIPAGGRKLVKVGGRAIVVFNLDGEFFALTDRCPHKGGTCATASSPGSSIVRARRIPTIRAGRDHPLPLARLGIRHPHRQILVRSRQAARAQLRGGGGAGRASWSKGRYVAETFPVSVENDYVVVEA